MSFGGLDRLCPTTDLTQPTTPTHHHARGQQNKGEKMLISNESLNELISLNNLSQGKSYTPRKLNELVSVLESKYLQSGYYNTVITETISIDSQNRAGIELKIQQGERVKIDKFRISGAEMISEETLLKLFKIGEADMALFNLFTNKDL